MRSCGRAYTVVSVQAEAEGRNEHDLRFTSSYARACVRSPSGGAHLAPYPGAALQCFSTNPAKIEAHVAIGEVAGNHWTDDADRWLPLARALTRLTLRIPGPASASQASSPP